MTRRLRTEIQQSKAFATLEEEVCLEVQRTSQAVVRWVVEALKPSGLTAPQFNVLRILRGAQPGGLPRCEIAPRLLERAPDVTRIVDRLVRVGQVERVRSEEDGRHSIARITRKGLALLDRLDPETSAVLQQLSERINHRDAETLSRLCELLYEEEL